MRYAQGGGLTDERRAFREKLRMEAAERFRQGDGNPVIARDLRVSVRSVQRWRRAWSKKGPRALASKGPASLPLLSDELFAVLERELAKGPVAHGWPDQTWTLSRIKTLIGRRFHKSYTVQGVAALLKRHGWSCQVPARRAIERDENLVAGWVKETWPSVEGPWRRSTPGSSKSFSWKDYRDLIQTAHQQLGGSIVLVWDNLNTHLAAGMRRYIADRDWLTVFQLPPAPDLNPVEGIWSVLRRTTTASRAFADPDDLITAVRRGLRQLQYRPDVLDGCLTGTGLRRQPP